MTRPLCSILFHPLQDQVMSLLVDFGSWNSWESARVALFTVFVTMILFLRTASRSSDFLRHHFPAMLGTELHCHSIWDSTVSIVALRCVYFGNMPEYWIQILRHRQRKYCKCGNRYEFLCKCDPQEVPWLHPRELLETVNVATQFAISNEV